MKHIEYKYSHLEAQYVGFQAPFYGPEVNIRGWPSTQIFSLWWLENHSISAGQPWNQFGQTFNLYAKQLSYLTM